MQRLTFSEFMIEGGPGMWPIMLFGLICVGAGVRFATRPDRRWLGITAAMWLTVVTATLHTTLIDVTSVLSGISDPKIPGDDRLLMLLQGLKESFRPGALGGIFLTLAALALAVGALRVRPSDSA
jgi:hypothetical protein